ncbi:hypothetical protein ACSBR2_009445 [Camellia fascicularis]
MSEEESDYEFGYEVLSAGSAEPWDDIDGGWVSSHGSVANTNGCEGDKEISFGGEQQSSTSMSELDEEIDKEVLPNAHEPDKASELDKGTHYDFEDLQHLMSEIKDSLRLMPDFQRREMAANLAMKMASMFGDSSDDDEDRID